MILNAGSTLRSLQSLNSHSEGSEAGGFYGPIFFFVVTALIALVCYLLALRENKSNNPD